jgi:hypothetical protein
MPIVITPSVIVASVVMMCVVMLGVVVTNVVAPRKKLLNTDCRKVVDHRIQRLKNEDSYSYGVSTQVSRSLGSRGTGTGLRSCREFGA